uniref:Diphthamide biosynthesis protein 7 homolog n=1 Tax=Schistocephalus solidus TaxID=70667 RepID=A0A0X3NHY5_SCHSO
MSFREISSFFLSLHTDSVEFSPSHSQLLCGSYELDLETRKISGRITLFTVTGEMVDLLKQHETAGVLDLSWFDDDVCLVALSTGEIGLVNLVGGFYNLEMSTYPLSSSLLLSIDVLDSRLMLEPSSPLRMAVYSYLTLRSIVRLPPVELMISKHGLRLYTRLIAASCFQEVMTVSPVCGTYEMDLRNLFSPKDTKWAFVAYPAYPIVST